MQNRLITINIRKYLSTQPRTKRINKNVKFLIARVAHLTKVAPENVKIDQNLNTLIFKKYSKTMVPMKVNVSIDNGMATVTQFAEKTTRKEAPKAEAVKEVKKAEAKK